MDFSKDKRKEKITNTGTRGKREKNRFGVFLVSSAAILFFGILFVLISFAIGAFTQILKDTPTISSIEDIRPRESKSILYASDGSVLEELVQSGSNRISVSYDQMPPYLVNAFVAIEDARFFEHEGVDVKGVLRAIFVALSSGSLSEGASTITQQLIKNNIFDGGFETNYGDRIARKVQEQYLALRIEKQVDKKTILQYYLNTINLGSNCLGVEVAAKKYFGKDVWELDLSEATVLAATTSNPSRYNPITHPDKNQIRRLIVLEKMLEQGFIEQNEYEQASSEDVYKRVRTSSASTGGDHVFSYFTDTVFEDVVSKLIDKLGYSESQAYNLMYSGGLRIYTTVDPDYQKILEEEVNREENYIVTNPDGTTTNYLEYSLSYRLGIRLKNGSEYYYDENAMRTYYTETVGDSSFTLNFHDKETPLRYAEDFKNYILSVTQGEVIAETVHTTLEPQTSAVLIDPSNGYIRAIVGGRGDKKEVGSLVFNRATQALRQPGSTFKTLVTYAPALDIKGATLATTYYDAPLSYADTTIHNWWGEQYFGYSNIREGLMVSMNIIAVRCMEDTVSENLAYEYAKTFGITTLVPKDKSPVLTLGGITYGVSNLELTEAYATIKNNGVYISPISWTHITDSNGTIILTNEQVKRTVLKEETAKLLTSGLESTVTPPFFAFLREGATSTNIACQVEGQAMAAKSGTTSDANDLWLVGYSPYYALGVWSGYDSVKAFGESPGYHKTMWQKIMARIHENLPEASFDYSGLVKKTICSKSGLLAKEGVCDCCGDENSHVYEEYFTPSTVPTEYCNRHVLYRICTSSGKLATEFCPDSCVEEKIYFVIDAEDSDKETDDTFFTLPEELKGTSCPIHATPNE